MKMVNIIINTYLLCLFIYFTYGIMYNLHPNTQKCLRDEMQANQLVLGEYEVSDAPGQKIDYVVCGNLLLFLIKL